MASGHVGPRADPNVVFGACLRASLLSVDYLSAWMIKRTVK
jgi:hypothetical protein